MNRQENQTRRALISVSDKSGLIPLAQALTKLSFEIVSTGGTAKALRASGIAVTDVSALTNFPEIMDGRVKTLHPAVYGGLLARTGIDESVLAEHGIGWIDLLVVNLYPFESTATRPDSTLELAIENIDVGGPAMLRAAAKNHDRVTVVIEPGDYPRVLEALEKGEAPLELRRELAVKAFRHTCAYDGAISSYLNQTFFEDRFPEALSVTAARTTSLRYGENPHQKAALYRLHGAHRSGIADTHQVQGKPLSFNNIADTDAALQCAGAFEECACVIVKHANPCGAALASTPLDAYEKAYRTDPTSAFGGIIALNRTLDGETASAIIERQLVDVIVAPKLDDDARSVLEKKPNIRALEAVIRATDGETEDLELRSVAGGLLAQQSDFGTLDDVDLRTVTKREPTATEIEDLRFAWTIVKYVKSNAIVYASGRETLGVGAGQTSRVISARIAAMKAGEEGLDLKGAAMASDAFFPFRDSIDIAASHGITCVIQPGGSIRDEEVILAADEHGIAMALTGMRHFRH